VQQWLTSMVWSAGSQTCETVITDIAGNIAGRQRHHLEPGKNTLRVSVLPLVSGQYFVSIRTQDGVQKTIAWIKE
jgi:hypothetical protein